MAALFSSSISRRKSRDASKIFRAMRLQTLAERWQWLWFLIRFRDPTMTAVAITGANSGATVSTLSPLSRIARYSVRFFCSSGSSRSRDCVIRNFIVSSKVQVNQARGQDTCRSLPRPRIFSKEICFSTRENNNNHEFPWLQMAATANLCLFPKVLHSLRYASTYRSRFLILKIRKKILIKCIRRSVFQKRKWCDLGLEDVTKAF